MAIELKKETKEKLISSIKRYFDEELDEPIGDLKATLFLEFCLKEVGSCVYNQAIKDAQTYFSEKVTSLDETCYEAELSYWKDLGENKY